MVEIVVLVYLVVSVVRVFVVELTAAVLVGMEVKDVIWENVEGDIKQDFRAPTGLGSSKVDKDSS